VCGCERTFDDKVTFSNKQPSANFFNSLRLACKLSLSPSKHIQAIIAWIINLDQYSHG
jgi:hypothetical protein